MSKYIRVPRDKSPRIPTLRELFQLSRISSMRQKYTVITLGLLSIASMLAAIVLISNAFMVSVPVSGGSFSEGILGIPRFVNPLLALSDVDHDLGALVYSGLLRADGIEQYTPDLAQSYTISPDGLSYTFTLKNNLYWHDGAKLTSADVLFTVNKARDEVIKSPRRASWEGVTVEAPDEHTIKFTLTKPYAPFLENMTMGILPEHLWKNVSPEDFSLNPLNLKAIGSGPYKIDSISYDGSGLATTMHLSANSRFALGTPYIKNITLKFYTDESKMVSAYKSRSLDSISGISTETALEEHRAGKKLITGTLPRIFAVFLNPNQSPALADTNVRRALELATPREKIVSLALGGFAIPEYGPTFDTQATETNVGEAKALLKGKDYTVTLATSDSPELSRAVEILRNSWSEIGVTVVPKVYEISDLNQNIIRPRKFEALLFGMVLGHFPDPYAFWHSSQRLDPHLGIAGYTNPVADKALETARASEDPKVRAMQYKVLEDEMQKDTPAIFLYAPQYVYLPPANVQGIEINPVGNSSDRFINVYKWHILNDRVWRIWSRS